MARFYEALSHRERVPADDGDDKLLASIMLIIKYKFAEPVTGRRVASRYWTQFPLLPALYLGFSRDSLISKEINQIADAAFRLVPFHYEEYK
ncbi:MAG: hypothetical protein ACAI35_22135 [Candidatus Methylacidiphilales bacterium]